MNKSEALAYLSSNQMRARLDKSFMTAYDIFDAQSQVNSGIGLFTGLSMPLIPNIARLTNEWAVYAEKLRELAREGVTRSMDRGFTESQAKLIAFFFQLRVVYADQPTVLLYGTECSRGPPPSGVKALKGLWAVPVEEPENCQQSWPTVCEQLTSTVWACDESPCSLLGPLFEQKVQEMHEPKKPGYASTVLADIEQVTSGNPGRFLMQLILNTQLYLRAANAFNMEHSAFMPEDLRKEMMDDIELVKIDNLLRYNPLHNVAQVPKKLYEHEFGPFVQCYVRLSDDSEHATCLPLGVANYIFPNFREMLQKMKK